VRREGVMGRGKRRTRSPLYPDHISSTTVATFSRDQDDLSTMDAVALELAAARRLYYIGTVYLLAVVSLWVIVSPSLSLASAPLLTDVIPP
jgi:hypothetical protein